MGTKINIAAILKDKPQGTKLYSPIFGNLRYEDLVPDLGEFTVVTSDNTSAKHSFRSDSRYNRHGEPLMLLPSKEMRDWSKFAWKKGDLLINSCGFQCIFKEWASDDYTKFNGCYSNSRDGYEDVSNAETAKFAKLDNNIAYGYVREIERKAGGILNLETLEIEPVQPEFKDGDILSNPSTAHPQNHIFIFSKFDKNKDFEYHVALVASGEIVVPAFHGVWCRKDSGVRYATEGEKQQLFDALAKEGKAWDAEKKQVVDLEPKCELKPFDKVLVRDSASEKWRANLFGYIGKDGYYYCVYANWIFCIPYEGNESLLGKTNDVEG